MEQNLLNNDKIILFIFFKTQKMPIIMCLVYSIDYKIKAIAKALKVPIGNLFKW